MFFEEIIKKKRKKEKKMLDSSDEPNCQIMLDNVTSQLFSLKIRIGPGVFFCGKEKVNTIKNVRSFCLLNLHQ